MIKIPMVEIHRFFAEAKTDTEFASKFGLSKEEAKGAIKTLKDMLIIDPVSLSPDENYLWNQTRDHNTDGTLNYVLNIQENSEQPSEAEAKPNL